MSKPNAALIQRSTNANDALLYERLQLAEQKAWESRQAAERIFEEANLEWSNCYTAMRLFEDGDLGGSNERAN